MAEKKWDSLQEIVQRYPMPARKAQYYGYVQSGTSFHDALYSYYEPDMPYNIAKGRVGDPDDWIEQKLEDMGFFDNPITRGY